MLEPCRLIIAEGTTRLPDQHAHARGLIRCLEALPLLERVPKRVERRVRMAFGEGDRAVGLRHHRAQDVGVERLRQLSQLIAGASGLLDISDRQHDLEMRRQEPGASQPIAGRARQPADRRTRGVGASLRQPQERESWLRLASPFARGVIGVLRLRKLAAQAMDLGLLIERGAGRLALGALGTLTGAAGFGQRVRPRSLQLQDLGTMHEAGAGKRDHVRLLLAHARERGRPFASAAQGIDLPAGVDHAAVHQPGHDRRQLVRDDSEHRLVQALQAGERRRPGR